jgi:hypothetical protein
MFRYIMKFKRFFLALFSCVIYAYSIFAAQAKDTIQTAKPPDSVSRQDSTKNDVKFEYKVIAKDCDPAFFKIKNTHSIMKNTVRVQFYGDGGACTYACHLTKNSDTLNISASCVPRSQEQHQWCFCINCKITGLKKGIYYLNYGEGYKKIKIK